MPRERLDVALCLRKLADSREKARALIMAGRVYIGEEKADKPSRQVDDGDILSVRGELNPFVSRGGHKLQKAFEVFGLDAQGAVCVDIGASTGGFTDVLLRQGAARVYAVDVGYGQLDYKLRSDGRVVVMERTNARYLTPEMFDPPPTLGVTDVSFISLRLILPPALALMPGGRFVALVKPQFEAGRERVGKRGVVRERAVHRDVLLGMVEFIKTLNWTAQALSFSPITGPEGNIEFLLDIVPDIAARQDVGEADIDRIIQEAYDNLVK